MQRNKGELLSTMLPKITVRNIKSMQWNNREQQKVMRPIFTMKYMQFKGNKGELLGTMKL